MEELLTLVKVAEVAVIMEGLVAHIIMIVIGLVTAHTLELAMLTLIIVKILQ